MDSGQPAPAPADPDHLVAFVGDTVHDGLDAGVETGDVASAGQDADPQLIPPRPDLRPGMVTVKPETKSAPDTSNNQTVADHLTHRELNRATLSRQHLLEHSSKPALEMIDHLVGMQAQNPHDPYFGLWARLNQFDPADLSTAISLRHAVRTAYLRATIHLVTSNDLLALDPSIRPVSKRVFASTSFARAVAGIDLGELLATGRALLEERPRSRADLSRLLAVRWPDHNPQSMAQAVTYNLALVQVPPRGLWDHKGNATWTTVESWLGREIDSMPDLPLLVFRYLAAFGPATVGDMRTWSGVSGLAIVVDGLRDRLRAFTDENGRELFDLPDAPRPEADTPAPPRFLPEYDNVLLGHADRARIIPADVRPPGWEGNLLHDGFLVGSWKLGRTKSEARIVVSPFRRMTKRAAGEVADEAARLLTAVGPGLRHELEFRRPS